MKRSFPIALTAILLVSCSQTAPQSHVPGLRPSGLTANDVPVGQGVIVNTPDAPNAHFENKGGTLFLEVEGTLSPEAYANLAQPVAHLPRAERLAAMGREIEDALARMKRGANILALTYDSESAYFTFLLPQRADQGMLEALKAVQFKRGTEIYFNPVSYDRDSLVNIRALTPAAEGLVLNSNPRGNDAGFSGLERIGAIDFARIAEQSIGGGVKVDGSSVKLGVTDTGITYNHPTFLSADGHNRISYMRDFTREGRVYFNSTAKFEVTAAPAGSDYDLSINAQVINTPKLPTLPSGDTLADVNDLHIKASSELVALLTAANSKAKLGILNEDSMNGDTEKVDINHNGKIDDKLFMILIPGATVDDDKLYVAFYNLAGGRPDFSNAQALGAFNKTGQTVKVYSEKIGFDLRDDKLPKADGSGVMDVRSASVVGFDPGNHGSHVSGIAAGRHTFSNAPVDTLARGVAPEAQILLNRVCANNGGCNATQAMIDLANNAGVEVINMSLGGLSPFNDGFGVQETVVNRLTAVKNVLFVISAGNSGPGRQTIGSPSTARLSLSVGAAASKGMIQRQYQWDGSGATTSDVNDDFMLFFTSRGPTAAGGYKPNIAAPGTELSSVQLNTAPGGRSGLDVYWGTSMAAPTTTGAYALFVDAIKKYNLRNPSQALSTDATVLRAVLMESARPFDMDSYDAQTGERKLGQYSWVDEGKGMIDLVSAWKKLFELRDNTLPSGVVDSAGKSVELDYEVLTSLKNPTGEAYDGSRAWADDQNVKSPAFGTGLYLDYYAHDTYRQVNIARRLSQKVEASADAGDLAALLATSGEEFVLKTVYYGSDKKWLNVGTLAAVDCANSPTSNLRLIGRGAEISQKEDGTGTISPVNASILNICVNRQMIQNELPKGDQSALISAYRTINGAVASVPSFTVPVYVTVPHRTLAGNTAYEVSKTVKSFGVDRNYVTIPKATSVVRITLELPKFQAETGCMGVELMALQGGNTLAPKEGRPALRISNCTDNGAPSDAKRTLVLTRTTPVPGIWDLHVFGRYQYPSSTYKLRVDYVVAEASVKSIEGPISALTGSLNWTLKESSLHIAPDAQKSSFELNSLISTTKTKVAQDGHVIVEGALGKLRAYPHGAKSVTVTTGGSAGNDIDLAVLECPAVDTNAEEAGACTEAGASGGSNDVESVTFAPKAGKFYAVRVDGYAVHDEGNFDSGETITFESEKGTLAISGGEPTFRVDYSFTAEQLAASFLANHPLFTSGKCQLGGDLILKDASDVVLGSVPLKITGTVVAPAPAPSPSPSQTL